MDREMPRDVVALFFAHAMLSNRSGLETHHGKDIMRAAYALADEFLAARDAARPN